MPKPDSRKVARKYLERQSLERQKTAGFSKAAGEVIFRKDNSNNKDAWSKHGIPPSKRRITSDFNYSPKNAEPIAEVLRSASVALGHAISAHNKFFRLKSSKVSPDGSLGGLGNIMTIPDIRTQFANITDSLSRITDTLYDEVKAPYWAVYSRQDESPEGQKVKEMVDDTEEVRKNPERWADDNLEEEFEE